MDAAFHHDSQSGATGVVARDDKGDFLAAASWFLPHVNNVDCVELCATRNGLYLAANVGGNRVIVESESAFAVQTLNQHEDYFGPEIVMVRECHNLANESEKVSYDHCFREADEIADYLAKLCFSSRASSLWDSNPPDSISHMLVNDLSII